MTATAKNMYSPVGIKTYILKPEEFNTKSFTDMANEDIKRLV